MIEVDAADSGKALIELALDSGEITAQSRRDRVAELESWSRGRRARSTS